MESDLGKLFIGGISWDTDEDRLKEYFGSYGEVAEAVIMRDRTTGRARGFGFVVFTDPTVAEKVVAEKHMIDGRTVEAKKAVPRDDHNMINRNSSANIHGSPNLTRTKKIFVGGLASTVTESDFKTYFDQFGTITDVVVMYDHNTQRPRGFGFITYDSEESVDKVFLHSTFHELNGKMVEVKRAVPKELSPSPARSPLVGPNYSFSRANSILNSFSTQGYNMNGIGNYGLRMDNRFSPVGSNRAEFSPFGSPGFGMGMNLEPGLTQDFGGGSNFGNNPGYGRVLNPYMNTNSNRYITPIGYSGGSGGRSNSFLNSPSRNSWGGGGGSGLNISTNTASANAGSYLGSGSGNYGFFGNNGGNWGPSVISGQAGGGSSSGGNIVYGGGGGGVENSYGLGGGGIGRSVGPVGVNTMTSSFSAPSGIGGYEGSYGDLYRGVGGGGGGGSTYGGDPTWQSASSEIDDSDSFGYGLGNVGDVSLKVSEGYVGNYSIADRQSNRGIAA